eukprot:GFYU01009146.1.p1 GENE.GFYU01009146.1~~GFYU01009146.1.p1  ORF type:complete len:337 (+),score=82.55 GFYU01009146.1:114-1124(+)
MSDMNGVVPGSQANVSVQPQTNGSKVAADTPASPRKEDKKYFNEETKMKTVLMGGGLLAWNAGWVGSYAVLEKMYGGPYMTGTSTKAAVASFQGLERGGYLFLAAFFFMVGAMMSGILVGNTKFKLGKAYGVALLLESVLLAVGAILMDFESEIGQFFLFTAMGLQNALCTNYAGRIVLRTTHLTGLYTDVGIILGHYLRTGKTSDMWKLKVFGCFWTSYIVGALCGSAAHDSVGANGLWVSAGLVFAMALSYGVWRVRSFKDIEDTKPETKNKNPLVRMFSAADDLVGASPALRRLSLRHRRASTKDAESGEYGIPRIAEDSDDDRVAVDSEDER